MQIDFLKIDHGYSRPPVDIIGREFLSIDQFPEMTICQLVKISVQSKK